MEEVAGTRTFRAGADAYDAFMGRYSRALAPPFADVCLPLTGRFLDVGCGPGALTEVAVGRLGAGNVAAVDPAEDFVAECRVRCPGVEVRRGRAEGLPFEGDSFEAAAAQLVFHFVSDADASARELARVVRPGGVVSACVWEFGGMDMLEAFWDAAVALDEDAPTEARILRFGEPGQLGALFVRAGLDDVRESTIAVRSVYRDFEELWASFTAGIGPAGAYTVAQPGAARERLRGAFFARLGSPSGSFELGASARTAVAAVPG